MDSVYQIVLRRRTIRRFKEKIIPLPLLKKLVNAARLAPSGANLQPLEFLIIDDKKLKDKIFPHLRWAGYIAPRGSPPLNKRPAVYIIVLINKKKATLEFVPYDVGAAVENILLCAWEEDLGGCWMKAFDKEKISKILKIPKYLEIDSVVSLGYRDELPKVEAYNNSVRYWLDKNGRLHVPKRSLKEILHHNKI